MRLKTAAAGQLDVLHTTPQTEEREAIAASVLIIINHPWMGELSDGAKAQLADAEGGQMGNSPGAGAFIACAPKTFSSALQDPRYMLRLLPSNSLRNTMPRRHGYDHVHVQHPLVGKQAKVGMA